MKTNAFYFLLLPVASLLLAGCGPRESKITSLQRKEAVGLASEAEFALTLRDLPRVESALEKAVNLCPDNGDYWTALGSTRMRRQNRDGAKLAYRNALKAYEDDYARDKTEVNALLQQVYVLALLGQEKDARAVLAKAAKNHPADQGLREYIDGKQLDLMLADPNFKQFAL